MLLLVNKYILLTLYCYQIKIRVNILYKIFYNFMLIIDICYLLH